MEKRLVVAVVLSIGVLYAYSFLFPPPKRVAPPAASAPQAERSATVASAPSGSPAAASAVAPAAPGAPAVAAQDVTVDTDLYRAVFSTQGGGLKKFVLKKYREEAGPEAANVVLLNETQPSHFALLSQSKELGVESTALYTVNTDELKLSDGESGTLEFRTTTPQGIVFSKVYSFTGDKYSIGLTQEVRNTGNIPANGTIHLVQNTPAEERKAQGRYEVHGAFTFAGEGVSSENVKDIEKEPMSYDKGVLWSAFADKYFMDAVIAEKGSIASVRVTRPGSDLVQRDIASPALSVPPGQSAATSHTVFYGPKDSEILEAQGHQLEEAIDYGWFASLAKPLMETLKFFYKYTHNYGIAIIIITVILKILFFPLTHKSYKSMKDMQKLQPMMTELREKYKNDRNAMNMAVMELYKTHKVNPMGGCLPMLVQIPVFFALYRALMYAIELRHAPFMLWITDLSAKDPYYVTPILMGATMFIQQKMTPTTMDPIQAKMMLALPVVFTFMFLNFPSGLVVYWLVNNILTIAQQAYINKVTK